MYVVEYNDRDREDMDQEELQYAIDFYDKSITARKKTRAVDSDEDESYQPSPQVSFFPLTPMT